FQRSRPDPDRRPLPRRLPDDGPAARPPTDKRAVRRLCEPALLPLGRGYGEADRLAWSDGGVPDRADRDPGHAFLADDRGLRGFPLTPQTSGMFSLKIACSRVAGPVGFASPRAARASRSTASRASTRGFWSIAASMTPEIRKRRVCSVNSWPMKTTDFSRPASCNAREMPRLPAPIL